MANSRLNVIPGPTTVLPEISKIYSNEFGSTDLEEEFFGQYKRVQILLREILKASDDTGIVIMSGEGMLALWSALKSVVKEKDRVLAIASGVFGFGIAEMAKNIGAEVKTIEFEYDEVVQDFSKITDEIQKFKPKLVTMVHCETPSGTTNPLKEIGEFLKKTDSLYYVDFVASAGGTPLHVSDWGIDLGLLGSQKCLSLPPDLSIISVSQKAWKIIDEVGYVGYDALKPWKTAVEIKYFPYTHNWRAIAAMEESLNLLKKEGFENVIRRHENVAQYCRERIQKMGLKIFPKKSEFSSPTVTAVYVPEGWNFSEFNEKLREKNVVVGGNYGKLQGKVFRIGHMGTQANLELIKNVLDVIESLISKK